MQEKLAGTFDRKEEDPYSRQNYQYRTQNTKKAYARDPKAAMEEDCMKLEDLVYDDHMFKNLCIPGDHGSSRAHAGWGSIYNTFKSDRKFKELI